MPIPKNQLKKISDFLYEIPKSYNEKMRVPAYIYASSDLLDLILQDRSLDQLVNAATLPVYKKVLAMPDAHEGYGLPIGGVMATELPNGIISPGSIGYDINCGVRLLASQILFNEIRSDIPRLVDAFFAGIPSGLGRGGKVKLSISELDQLLTRGVEWAITQGYGESKDLDHIEENGKMNGADPAKVSDLAKKRGADQIGTLGSGNHFLEVQKVSEIFDQPVAKEFGLFSGQITILIHTGSRGLGHQIASDYIPIMNQVASKYQLSLPDRELAAAPLSSPEGQNYFAAQACAANYAWVNRQYLTYLVRQIFDRILADKIRDRSLDLVYDIAHNIGKIEIYDGKKLLVHRKGATRCFGPGRAEIPPSYRKSGQPVIIPGSMGTSSYVLVGTTLAERQSFGSTCHGAGRVMSRGEAKRRVRGQVLQDTLAEKGIIIRSGSMAGLAEEAPIAYKNVDEVVDVVHQAGLARKVAKLIPLGVIKG